MKTQPPYHSLRIFAFFLMISGAVTSVLSSQMHIYLEEVKNEASVTGQGSALIMEALEMEPELAHSAAMNNPENALGILAFGMLMMLFGFGLHAFIVLRNRNDNQEERSVPIKQAPRRSRKQMEVIWVERTIRL